MGSPYVKFRGFGRKVLIESGQTHYSLEPTGAERRRQPQDNLFSHITVVNNEGLVWVTYPRKLVRVDCPQGVQARPFGHGLDDRDLVDVPENEKVRVRVLPGFFIPFQEIPDERIHRIKMFMIVNPIGDY